MEPHRTYPGDGDQRWYDGEDWERGGRHGTPPSSSPSAAGGGFDAGSAPAGAEDAAFGEIRRGDGYERAYAAGVNRYPDAAAPAPRFGDTDPSGELGADPAHHPVESIDVGALRRTPVSSPPVETSSYGSNPQTDPPRYVPPVDPPFAAQPDPPPYAPQPEPGPFASHLAPAPAFQYPGAAAYATGEQPLFPADFPADFPGGSGHNDAFSAPTAAVSTIQPGNQSGGQPSSSVVYHSRKPAVAIIVAVLTMLFEIPALRLLISATIEEVVSASGIVAGVFLVGGLPAFGYGLFGLLGGGTTPTSPAPWLKAPLVYLPVGVLLFVLAALAAA